MATASAVRCTPERNLVMADINVPRVNFSPLSTLFQGYAQGRKVRQDNDTLAGRQAALDKLPKLPDGSPDFGAAAYELLRAGDLQGASLLARFGHRYGSGHLSGSNAGSAVVDSAGGGEDDGINDDNDGSPTPTSMAPLPSAPPLQQAQLPQGQPRPQAADDTGGGMSPQFPGVKTRADANAMVSEAFDAIN